MSNEVSSLQIMLGLLKLNLPVSHFDDWNSSAVPNFLSQIHLSNTN